MDIAVVIEVSTKDKNAYILKALEPTGHPVLFVNLYIKSKSNR